MFEAGTGLGFLTIAIGYLPVLYQLFSRRETHVIMLDSRAGSPPIATTLLSRHGHRDSTHALDHLLRGVGAMVGGSDRESSLIPDAQLLSLATRQSIVAGCTDGDYGFLRIGDGRDKRLSTLQARMTFSNSRLGVIELSRVLAVKPKVMTEARLTSSDYAQMRTELKDSGMLIVKDEGAEERLLEFRSTYELFLVGLAEYLLLTLPGWLPSRRCSTLAK
jgi:hypothetical protein